VNGCPRDTVADRLGFDRHRHAENVVILLLADNKGEGGTLALMALAQRGVHRPAVAILLGITSMARFYGNSVITPPFRCCRMTALLSQRSSLFSSKTSLFPDLANIPLCLWSGKNQPPRLEGGGVVSSYSR
jgi:hypothetical protein